MAYEGHAPHLVEPPAGHFEGHALNSPVLVPKSNKALKAMPLPPVGGKSVRRPSAESGFKS